MTTAWDPLKAVANVRKHGIRFADAETVMYDPFAVAIAEADVDGEHRLVVVGTDHRGRVLAVVYVHRADTIRIISARRATRQERNSYEAGV